MSPKPPACCSRRELLAATPAVLAAGLLPGGLGARPFAGPFSALDSGQDDFPIPADKKLDPQWLASLQARGQPEIVPQADASFIGMPVGGFFAGTVYLGGDGRLWNWDIFNQPHEGGVARPRLEYRGQSLRERDGANYVDPPTQQSPFLFETALHVDGGAARPLDRRGWQETQFRGSYPIGEVAYRDSQCDLQVDLEAFSPFVPMEVELSSFPATFLRYRLRNSGTKELSGSLRVRLSHPVLIHSRDLHPDAQLQWRSVENAAGARLFAWAEASPDPDPEQLREDLLVANFESGDYQGWTATGTAFGARPRRQNDLADYQGKVGAEGEYFVNSHQTRHGEDVRGGDQHTGTLRSDPFQIQRRYLRFLIGGGRHPQRTSLDLVVAGQVVRSATGHDGNSLREESFDLLPWQGQDAHLVIRDEVEGAWGNIGVDRIFQSDRPAPRPDFRTEADHGSFAVAVGGADSRVVLHGDQAEVVRPFRLAAGAEDVVECVVGWHFPNLRIPGMEGKRRWYASRWADAGAVVEEVQRRLPRLHALTVRWRDTWYDSTLPYWLLDRSFIPLSTLATNTCHRFEDGRYWFWEGIGCCPGTCTHVWGYAQAIGRVFPEIERDLREQVDYGIAFHSDSGAIDYRAEYGRRVAHDGQASCVLRAWREHLMCPDDAFLRRLWPRIRQSLEFLIAEDRDQNGLLEGPQYNTLDAAWYGPMGWISSLYVAALAAGAAMADRMQDRPFAARCRRLAAVGGRAIEERLFNGEYFVHLPDPDHPEANATSVGCHIDQVYGQAWAHQVGLGRILGSKPTRSALRSLWKYNFAPDVGVYRDWIKDIAGGRWYAVPGDAGLLMCTFPKGGADRATGKGQSAWAAMYMNECMTGFEYQVAAHMVWEGLVEEGLAVARAIHDRYAPALRNPYNEIECSDHYGRAMAGFGVFVAACGWHHDGPAALIRLDPRLSRDRFRAPFTGANSWGSISYQRDESTLRAQVEVRHGSLQLQRLELPAGGSGDRVQSPLRLVGIRCARKEGGEPALPATVESENGLWVVTLAEPLRLGVDQRLEVEISSSAS